MVIQLRRRKRRKVPNKRRKYHSIYGLDGGLNYSMPSTMIDNKETPGCEEVLFRDKTIKKAYGTTYFAGTGTVPLLGTYMFSKRFIKNDETEKYVVHTTSNVYVYNTTSSLLECITNGEIVENCEDVWSVNAPTTCAVTTTGKRKGTNCIAITIPTAEGTGVCAYEDFGADDFTAATYLHFFIKSSIALASDDFQLILGDTTGGGTPVGGSDSGRFVIPALVAGVWKEVSIAITTPANLTTVESVALYIKVDKGACVVNIDDVMVTVQPTGDVDNNFVTATVNNYHVFSNGIAPMHYWDQATATVTVMLGTAAIAAKAMMIIGERLCLYRIPSYPRRVQWTVVGALSTTPVATDWTNSGSGDVDLDSTFGDDVIMTAHRLGNYTVIYGKKTIAMQEYVNKVDQPYSFYIRVADIGTPSERGVANLGDKHILFGDEDFYMYKGGTYVESVGDKVSKEIFNIINPEFVSRSFMVYLRKKHEVRFYFPLAGSATPNCYFSYNLDYKCWSRGSRDYTGHGIYRVFSAETWDEDDEIWDDDITRWDDSASEALSIIHVYGDSSGVLHLDDETVLNKSDGSVITSYWDTKDFVIGEGYRRDITSWMELGFEAKGDTVTIYYSTDAGVSWSAGEVFTLTDEWQQYHYDKEIASSQVRYRIGNAVVSETYEARQVEVGFVPSSDRGVG